MARIESRLEVVRVSSRILTPNEYRRRVEYVLNLTRPHPIDGRKWRCVDVKKTRYMIQLTYEIPSKYSSLDVQKQIDALVATCGADVEIVNYAGRVGIRIYPIDLPDVIPFKPEMIEYNSSLFLGINRMREHVRFHFENPHLLVAAETGWGKTVLLTLILWQLIRRDPQSVEIVLIDMKGTSFLHFIGLPHIIHPICTELEEAHDILLDTVAEMRRRKETVLSTGKFPRFKKRFVIIDEAAELSPSQNRDPDDRKIAQKIDSCISTLARVGREFGIHIIYCTQYPHSDVLNPQIKVNAGARICFHVPAEVNSRVVLDEPGAEQISVKGRAIFKTAGRREIIQVPFAEKKQWEEWLSDTPGAQRNRSASTIYRANHEHGSNRSLFPFRQFTTKESEPDPR
jgi:DNA segregation ATPase FtsK/SpoIIIE, S-DNA-T family